MRIALLSAALLIAPAAFAQDSPPEQATWVQELATKFDLPTRDVKQALSQATFQQSIIDAMTRPAEAKPWSDYRPIFLTEKRINDGVAFWQEHQALLDEAVEISQVPAEIITAIIGVETSYGTHMGNYKVLDALYTLGFHYPPRGEFFRSEFGHYLALAKEQGWSLESQKGSYAGAMGMGQFIPSSYRHYAIDADSDGVRDLFHVEDAIGSVANYFYEHDWQLEEGVAYRAEVKESDPEKLAALIEPALEINHTWAEFVATGIVIDEELAADTPVKLIKLEGAKGTEYWVVRHNFYVITRYNRSPLYAMAVYQLSEQIKHAYEKSL